MSSTRGPRLILQKLKRHASALVLRSPPPPIPREEDCDPRVNQLEFIAIPTVSPYIHVTHSHSTIYDDDDISLPQQTDDFLPYIPLVSQYERAAANSLKVVTDPHTIFSRPVSAITSTTTSTPIFTTRCSSRSSSTWSLSTHDDDDDDDDSIPSPTPYPFEKRSIQLVQRLVAPANPPPSCPLPTPPPETDPHLLRIRETEEWTLKLNLPAPNQQLQSISSQKLKQIPPKPTTTTHLLQPPPMHKRPLRHASQPQMQTHTQTQFNIKPKPKIMRVQIEPENALDIDKDDWTLSLPLSLPHPPGINVGGPSDEGRRRYTSQPGPSARDREREQGIRDRKSVQSLPSAPRPSVSYANLGSVQSRILVPVAVQDPPQTQRQRVRLGTADSASSAATITPTRQPIPTPTPTTPPLLVPHPTPLPTTPTSLRSLCSYCSRTLPQPQPLPSPTYSTSSFADSGVGILTSEMGMGVKLDMERQREREREMRWVDGVRLPSTPNLNGGWRGGEGAGGLGEGGEGQGVGREGGREEREGEGDGHSMYYSARSSVCFSSEA